MAENTNSGYADSILQQIESGLLLIDPESNYVRIRYLTPDSRQAKRRVPPNTNQIVRLIKENIVNPQIKIEQEQERESKQDEISVQYDFVRDILPKADPKFIESLCHQFKDNFEELSIKIDDLLKNRNYPTVDESTKTEKLSVESKQYTINFNIENFLKIIPNPGDYFEKMHYTVDRNVVIFLEALFCCICPSLEIETIRTILKKNHYNFLKSFQIIETRTDILCLDVSVVDRLYPGKNLPLLQQIAYCFHKEEIDSFIRMRDDELNREIAHALATNSMNTCQCCFSDDILPRLTHFCDNGCIFCRDCIVGSTEVAFGEGKLDFPCLAGCTGCINLQTLQFALPSKLFTRIVQKKAIADVSAAGIEGLEMCPFCDFAIIPPENDKIFKCLNPECMKESCRSCKELSHLPLKCDEVERDEETRARTFIENQMTEALLRQCYKCKAKFYKIEGCNMMTCVCGANMCYVCRQPIKDYNHFHNLRTKIPTKKCPLYSDMKKLHTTEVLNVVKRAGLQVREKVIHQNNL